MMRSQQQFHRDSCWRLPCFGLLGLDINIFFLVSWVSFWFLCLLKVTSAKTCWICLMWNWTGEKSLSFAELQAGREAGLSAACRSAQAGAARWSGRAPAQAAAVHLPCTLKAPASSGTTSFAPWAAHRAQCNLQIIFLLQIIFISSCALLFLFLLFCSHVTMLLFKAKAITKSWFFSPKMNLDTLKIPLSFLLQSRDGHTTICRWMFASLSRNNAKCRIDAGCCI